MADLWFLLVAVLCVCSCVDVHRPASVHVRQHSSSSIRSSSSHRMEEDREKTVGQHCLFPPTHSPTCLFRSSGNADDGATPLGHHEEWWKGCTVCVPDWNRIHEIHFSSFLRDAHWHYRFVPSCTLPVVSFRAIFYVERLPCKV